MRAVASLVPRSRVDTEALRLAHPVAEVVAAYGIDLRRHGRALVGRCIFHPDGGRPNLHVYPDSWRCYRCGIGGDVLAFVMHAEDIGFREAVSRLTEGRHGPPQPRARPPFSPIPPRIDLDGRSAEELAVLQAATGFYHSTLLAEPRALDYLASRGISLSTARECRLGYAGGDQLVAYLHWQRLSLGAALQLGLLTRTGHEALAGRLTIPEIRAGMPVWLTGRALAVATETVPTYLSLLGSKPLLGWDQARGSPAACVVEGAFDALTLRQWGYPVVGVLGTHLRPDQIEQLRTFSRLYLVLDGDDAGMEAALRLQEAIGPSAVPVTLPDTIKDPAELAMRPDGQNLFAQALLQAAGTSATDDNA